MSTSNKDFKVKNGIVVNGNGSFGGPVAVGTPTNAEHAATKAYVDDITALAGLDEIDGGSPTTVVWGITLDGGAP